MLERYATFVRSSPGSARLLESVLQYSGFLAPVSAAQADCISTEIVHVQQAAQRPFSYQHWRRVLRGPDSCCRGVLASVCKEQPKIWGFAQRPR
jgi:hypothetical protein